jgi:hypothetical protein
MLKNQKPAVVKQIVAHKLRSRMGKQVIILASLIILTLLFGWDPKFFIINIIWLLLS